MDKEALFQEIKQRVDFAIEQLSRPDLTDEQVFDIKTALEVLYEVYQSELEDGTD